MKAHKPGFLIARFWSINVSQPMMTIIMGLTCKWAQWWLILQYFLTFRSRLTTCTGIFYDVSDFKSNRKQRTSFKKIGLWTHSRICKSLFDSCSFCQGNFFSAQVSLLLVCNADTAFPSLFLLFCSADRCERESISVSWIFSSCSCF